MNLYEIISKDKIYFPKLEKFFPGMVETSKIVEVIPWKDEYAVNDRNPEIIDSLEFYGTLLDNGLITEKEFEEVCNTILTSYASKTVGIAFIEEKKVSFRELPTFDVALHELGHCHFQEPDPIWSATYGGGETLMWIGLSEKYPYIVTENEVRFYHTLLHDAETRPQELSKEIAEKITKELNFDCLPHLYALCLMAGTIPDGLTRIEKPFSYRDFVKDPKIMDLEVTRRDLHHFFVNMLEGIKWRDPFYTRYALILGLIKPEKD